MNVAKNQGTLSYAKVASGSSAALTVNASTGKVTVKKGTKLGTYTIKIKVTAAGNANYKAGSKTVACKVVVAKAANPMVVTPVAKTVSYAEVKAGNVPVARPMTISKHQGALSYAKVGGSGQLYVDRDNGRVLVTKGTPKGTYSIEIKVTAAGNANYKAGSKTVTCKITVK